MVQSLLLFGLIALFSGWAVCIIALLSVGVFSFLFKRNVKFQLADGIEAYALMAFRIGVALVIAAMGSFIVAGIGFILHLAANVLLQ